MTTVSEAINKRHSARAFLEKDVDIEIVKNIIEIAKQAPSGVNTQPWNIYVLYGDARNKLVTEATSRYDQGKMDGQEYLVYPKEMPDWYKERRRAVGWAMYGAIGIEKGDTEKMMAQGRKNYEFFGAPVGLFFRMDRELLYGSWLDIGMFMQNVMILARVKGLETCPQQAWCEFGPIVHKVLNIPDDEIIISGMSMGYAAKAPENTLVSERMPLDDFVTFLK